MVQFIEDLKMFGLSENYTEDELRAAYRRLAKKYHPDMYIGLSEDEIKQKEEEFKNMSNAHTRLKERLERKINGSSPDIIFNLSFDELVEQAVNDGDIEGCYNLYFLFDNRGNLTKSEMKKKLKEVMSENLYVILCIQAEKKELQYLCYENSELIRRQLNYDYTKGKCVLPIITAIVTRVLEKIEMLCTTIGYNYGLLEEIDKISIEFIDQLQSQYRESKFNAEHSFGYTILISLYDNKWGRNKDMIHSLAFDCNFSDLLREYHKITYSIDNVLEDMLLEKRKQILREYDRRISEKESKNNAISEEDLIALYWESRKVLDEMDYYYLFNYAYYNDTYVDKDIIERKLDEAVTNYINGIRERMNSIMQKRYALACNC